MASLQGRHALVTGGGRGIGRAIAAALMGASAAVTIAGRNEKALAEVVGKGEASGYVIADVTDPKAVESGVKQAVAARGQVDLLIANAGTATFGAVAELDPVAEQAQVQLNVLGVHDLVLAVLPGMLVRRAGGILISGSAAGNSPIPNNATYAATKAFANTFCESLRGELRDTGVHVTLLAPGPVRAEMPDASEASLVDKLIPDFLWISVEHTAVLSLDGLERNKMRVVPGVTSKAMSVASGYAPRAIVTPIVGAVYKKLGGD